MKKKFLILLLVMFIVGCKSKNLSCDKMIIDTDEVKVNEKISLNFKNKKLDKTFYTLDYHYANNVEQNAETTKKSLEEQFSIYKDSKGIEYFFSNLEEGIHFEVQISPEEITEEEKENFEKQVDYRDYTSAKESLIKDGYQCK